MAVTYNVRQARGVTVVDLSGRITTLKDREAPGSVSLHDLVRDLAAQGAKNILLNLRDIDYIDSSGIGELFACFTTVRSHGGTLKLSHPTERVRNLFRLTMLYTMIEVIEDESTAIQSFSVAAAS